MHNFLGNRWSCVRAHAGAALCLLVTFCGTSEIGNPPTTASISGDNGIIISPKYDSASKKWHFTANPTNEILTPRQPRGDTLCTLLDSGETYVTGGSSTNLPGGVQYRFGYTDGEAASTPWRANPACTVYWKTPGIHAVSAQARSAADTVKVSLWSTPLTVKVIK